MDPLVAHVGDDCLERTEKSCSQVSVVSIEWIQVVLLKRFLFSEVLTPYSMSFG